MALCEIKSEEVKIDAVENDDLEDGEIEDDDDVPLESAPEPEIMPPLQDPAKPQEKLPQNGDQRHEKVDRPKFDRRQKFDEGSPPRALLRKRNHHLTEAEKSVMFLHKMERIEREKRDKYRREPGLHSLLPDSFQSFKQSHFVVDDFASNLEKQLASVLKKDRTASDEDKDDEKRNRKRKKKERERRKKLRKLESPKTEETEEGIEVGVRAGVDEQPHHHHQQHGKDNSPRTDETYSDDSDDSPDRSGDERRDRKRERKERRARNKDRNRERRRGNSKEKKTQQQQQQQSEVQQKDNQHLCVYHIQGKCQKGDECPYSHESQPPMKWELCKFYLNDCCAKGEKCLYMHSDFPCKFYHTGQQCFEGDKCKFAHGKPLSDRLKQILFKHIETAPKDILGRFPRMSREEAIFKINQTQKNLENIYGPLRKDDGDIPSLFDLSIPMPLELLQGDSKGKDKSEKPSRNRPSRWQDADATQKSQAFQDQRNQSLGSANFNGKSFPSAQDLDLRTQPRNLNDLCNGDVDMRMLPIPISTQGPPPLGLLPSTAVPPPRFSPQNMSVPPPNMLPMNMTPVGTAASVAAMPLANAMPVLRLDEPRQVDIDQYKRDAGFGDQSSKMDVDIRSLRGDTDIRNNLESMLSKDVDIRNKDATPPMVDLFIDRDYDSRQPSQVVPDPFALDEDEIPTSDLRIVLDEPESAEEKDEKRDEESEKTELPEFLPKRQRELFMRIQAQQRYHLPEQPDNQSEGEDNNIDWYSDDDEERLTIKCDDDVKEQDDEGQTPSSSEKPQSLELVQKLGDLSQITTDDIAKILNTIKQNSSPAAKESNKPKDPRQASVHVTDESKPARVDPRKARLSANDDKPKEKISIYEQGSIPSSSRRGVDLRGENDMELQGDSGDIDLRSTRSDVDLRQLGLPFRAMQNYTPATEIKANFGAHPPIPWAVRVVDVPIPDYTGLRLSIQEAKSTGDPRLRKIFRLDVEEKDSPTSPKQSPRASSSAARVDPRIRKVEENKSDLVTYAQQMTILQSSSFYQNLTSNQKVKLNQEIAWKESGNAEMILNGILNVLGLIPSSSAPPAANPIVVNLLATISGMSHLGISPNPLNANMMQNAAPGMIGSVSRILAQSPALLNQNVAQNPLIQQGNPNMMNPMVQPGLLGSGPAMSNIQHDFQINFDPRNGGLLGNAPPFVNYQQENQNFNFAEDNFYPENGNFNNRDNHNRFNRENNGRGSRRGRSFGRNNRNNNFRNRNSRNHRGHATP